MMRKIERRDIFLEEEIINICKKLNVESKDRVRVTKRTQEVEINKMEEKWSCI